MKIEITESELQRILVALDSRADHFADILDNNEGFGSGIKEYYESERDECRALIKKLHN